MKSKILVTKSLDAETITKKNNNNNKRKLETIEEKKGGRGKN